jgi:hypothetical protein
MAPIIKATTATLAGLLDTITSLSGGSNGSAVTDFNKKSINTLPPLPGPNRVGVTRLEFPDHHHHDLPLCDSENYHLPGVSCHYPRRIMTSLL